MPARDRYVCNPTGKTITMSLTKHFTARPLLLLTTLPGLAMAQEQGFIEDAAAKR
jgi:hypothetical protein